MFFIVREDEYGQEMFFASKDFPILSNMKFHNNIVHFFNLEDVVILCRKLREEDPISCFIFYDVSELPRFLHIMN